MIDYKKILGNSGKNFISYSYKNKTYKVIRNNDGYLTCNIESCREKSDALFKITAPIVLQYFISYKTLPLYFFVISFFFIVYFFMRIEVKSRLNHGAEHMVINALENKRTLDLEEIRKESCLSYRCGGNFVIYILVVSFILRILNINIIISMFLNLIIVNLIWLYKGNNNPIYKRLTYLIRKPADFMQKYFTVANPKDENIKMAVMAMESLINDYQDITAEYT